MRVLMLSWEYPPKVIGGLGRHVTALSKALAQSGTEVTVLTVSQDGPEREEDLAGRLIVRRVREHNPPALNFPEAVVQSNTSLLQGAVGLVAGGGRYDVVHAHDWLTAYAARALKHGLNLPLIATVHATEFGRNGGLYNDLQRHISDVEWWLTYEAWRVICCSQSMQGELQSFFQVPRDKIDVIPNGVDMPRETGRRSEDDQVRSRYAEPQEPLIFFVGRLVHEKGADLLIQSFRFVLDKRPDAVLVVAGTGPERDGLIDLARRLGVLHRVRFPGYISDDERNTLYRAADVAAFPSRYEPFGIVALEAMAHGTPVVVAKTGGLAEVVEDGVTGLHFPPGDPHQLADRLVTLLGDDDRQRKMAAQARRVVEDRFDWGSIARRTLSVYRRVVEGQQGDAQTHAVTSNLGQGVRSTLRALGGDATSRYR